MRRRHFAAWAPHCPVCARKGAQNPLLLAPPLAEHGEEILAGTLLCADPACRHEYPIFDGIPIITPALRQLLGERAIDLLLRDDVDPALLSLLGDAMGPDSWLDHHRQALSTYVWDSYADLDPAESPPDSTSATPRPGAAARCLAALRTLAPDPLPSATAILDLGCAAGRTAFDAAAAAPNALVLGADLNLALLRLALQLARANPIRYPRRRIGLVYDARTIHADLPGRDRTDFWALDAAALPFAPGAADAVIALNLLDCVPDPLALLRAIAAALRPGGALLLATPFDWAARATQAPQWIGGHSQRGPGQGAAEPLLHSLLTPGAHPAAIPGLHLLATADHPWHTRLHDRASVSYQAHLLRAHKSPQQSSTKP